jgi:hypothetical protein
MRIKKQAMQSDDQRAVKRELRKCHVQSVATLTAALPAYTRADVVRILHQLQVLGHVTSRVRSNRKGLTPNVYKAV